MKLKRFRVTNFRSVQDSGWIRADDVTALIGVNESGKTNLLLPLWKLNPARDGEIVLSDDCPVKMYGEIRQSPGDYEFIQAEFESAALATRLVPMTFMSREVLAKVRVTKSFDGSIFVEFPNYAPPKPYKGEEISAVLKGAITDLDAIEELKKEVELKASLLSVVRTQEAAIVAEDDVGKAELAALVEKLTAALPEDVAPTSTLVPRYRQMIEAVEAKQKKLKSSPPQQYKGVREAVIEALPRFVYYSNYGNLDSEIYLPHVIQNLKRDDLGQKEAARARTLRVLFDFVRLSPEEIHEMGRDVQPEQAGQEKKIEEVSEKKKQRALLLQSAESKLTASFREWWKQGDYIFQFQADGDHFKVWVSDDRRPERVSLESRSTGLQWFLSFFLVFLVESDADHKNSILLLDEPGHSLHPLAQRDLSAFFAGLADKGQILYSTHSPFLIDADHLERARKVFVAEDGTTKSTENLRYDEGKDKNKGAAYAVHSALNMSIAESLLVGCQPVIVEGRSDQIYLTAIKTLLISGGHIRPARELVFPPGGGTKTSRTVASILTGRDEVLPRILLDGDVMGAKMAKELQTSLYQEARDRVLSTDTYVKFEGSEVEDLFPAEFFADVVDRWLRPMNDFADALDVGAPIVPQIEKWAAKEDAISLDEGWKVELARLVKERALAKGPEFFADHIAGWTALFSEFEK